MEGPAKYSGEVGALDDMPALLEGIPWISLLDSGRLRRARDGEDSETESCFFRRWFDMAEYSECRPMLHVTIFVC